MHLITIQMILVLYLMLLEVATSENNTWHLLVKHSYIILLLDHLCTLSSVLTKRRVCTFQPTEPRCYFNVHILQRYAWQNNTFKYLGRWVNFAQTNFQLMTCCYYCFFLMIICNQFYCCRWWWWSLSIRRETRPVFSLDEREYGSQAYFSIHTSYIVYERYYEYF